MGISSTYLPAEGDLSFESGYGSGELKPFESGYGSGETNKATISMVN